jgi:8-oxo-dGTP pyrophosphatase MutT (NUDIX family)
MDTSPPPQPAIVVPRPAASVLLLRDGPGGIEVFMATRHAKSSFMPGILVFPGGAVDADDSHPSLHGGDAPPSLTADALARIAGVRETFEEAGFLLARPRGGTGLVEAHHVEPLLGEARGPLCRGEVAFSAVMAEAGLAPAIDQLVPFAHWITPRYRTKRFDARFYLARAPEAQSGLHDDHELIDSRWITPADALAETAAGKIRIVFVTRSNLSLLAKSATVDEALEAARRRRLVTVEPQEFDSPDGPALRIPADAGFDVTEVLVRSIGE